MKVSLLIKREPFDKIFEETLASFLNDHFNIVYKIKWHKGGGNTYNKNSQIWYCNPVINSIFVKGANYKIFGSIIGEYYYNPFKPWRNLFQKGFFNLSISKYFASYLTNNFIEISPAINNAKNILIIGGNNKIRLIDYNNKLVYVILKAGFDSKYLKREIFIKDKYKYMPTPQYQSFHHHHTWYSEEYICGIGIDRIKEKKRRTVLKEVIYFMNRMIKESIIELSLSEYCNKLNSRIDKNLKKISLLSLETKNEILSVIKQLNSLFVDYNKKIYLCQSHGDFQEGNIIYDGKKVWIIDWEYTRTRQISYDLLVLLLKPRNIINYHTRFIDFKNNIRSKEQKWIINQWYNKKSNNIGDTDLLLFIIEELDFFIEQNNNNKFTRSYPDENIFIGHIKNLVEHIQ